MLASSSGGTGADARFALVRSIRPRALDGLAFYALLPFRVARELRALPARCRARAGRAGGSALRRRTEARARPHARDRGHPRRPSGSCATLRLAATKALAPLADALARYGLRRSDGVRTISAYTSGLVRRAGVEPTAEFAAFMDLEPFVASSPAPLPERPVALFVGVLERYKAVDVLAEAWRRAAPRVPDATLHLVGRGTLRETVEALVRRSARADALERVALHRGGRARTRRVHRPRAPLSLGGPRARRRRGVLPRPWCRRESRRWDPRHRGGRRHGSARAGSRMSTRWRTRSCAFSPTAPSPRSWARPRTRQCSRGWRSPEEYARRIRELVDEVTS